MVLQLRVNALVHHNIGLAKSLDSPSRDSESILKEWLLLILIILREQVGWKSQPPRQIYLVGACVLALLDLGLRVGLGW